MVRSCSRRIMDGISKPFSPLRCTHMEKRGSRYSRYASYNAAKYVCIWDPPLPLTSSRNAQKANIVLWLCSTPRRSLLGSSMPWRSSGCFTSLIRSHNLLHIHSLGALTGICFAVPSCCSTPLFKERGKNELLRKSRKFGLGKPMCRKEFGQLAEK